MARDKQDAQMNAIVLITCLCSKATSYLDRTHDQEMLRKLNDDDYED